MPPVLPADKALRVSHARIIAPRRTPKIKRSFMPNGQWFPAHVNFRAPVVSPVDGSHVRFVVALAGGRRQVAEPFELVSAQLDAVGGGVLLDAGDPPGAGDRGDVVALGEQPGQR